MFGRGETWKIEFPSVALLKAHADPYCKCCHQRLPLRALKPVFMYCMGENCGYDPCHPDDLLKRWHDGESSISSYIDEDNMEFVMQPMYIRKDIAELILWCFGHPVREMMEYEVLKQAKAWLKLAENTSVLPGWRNVAMCMRYTEYRKTYAQWVFKTVKIQLRAMKREGKIPTSATVR